MARSPRPESRITAALLTLLLATLACAEKPDAAAKTLAFSLHSEPVAQHDLTHLLEMAETRIVRVLEPYEEREIEFRALPLAGILDGVYGPTWRDEEEILLSCSDGYQPTVPVRRALDHQAFLAYARADSDEFSIQKPESGEVRRVDLGPFYLIWRNLDDSLVLQESDYGWPYQLVAIDLIRRQDRFPNMSPLGDAGPDVLAGFDAFRVHCSKCHRLHGEGGTIGPPLDAASNPLRYRDREWLRAWIEDPSRIVPNSRMPALNPALPDRARTVDQILAYLEVMLNAKES